MHQIPLAQSAGTRKGEMLYRTLGRTGENKFRQSGWAAFILRSMG